MKIELGVTDVTYRDAGSVTTTGQVAEILEANYGVMRTFVELHEADIGDELTAHMMALLDNSAMGAPLPFGKIAFPKIDAMFQDYLNKGEWEGTSMQPTAAAQTGINHRKMKPYAKSNSVRPSFIDTGLYSRSFRTWVEG